MLSEKALVTVQPVTPQRPDQVNGKAFNASDMNFHRTRVSLFSRSDGLDSSILTY
jgi:hypothetical protein